MFQEQTYFQ